MRRTFLLLCLPISFVVFAATANGCHFAGGLDDNDYGLGGGGPTSSNGSGGTGATGGSSGTGGMGECTPECGPCESCPTTNMCQPAPGQACDGVDGGSCDSVGTCVAGDAQWVTVFGSQQNKSAIVSARAMALTGDGIVVGGLLDGQNALTFGGDTLASVGEGDVDVFVAKLSPAGVGESGIDSGNNKHQVITSLATVGADVIVAGRFQGDVFGLTGSDVDDDSFVVKLTNGVAIDWKFSAGGTDIQAFYGVAASMDQVFATGEFVGTIAFNTNLDSGNLSPNAMLLSFGTESSAAPLPDPIWNVTFGGLGPEDSAVGRAVTVDGNGNVIWVGRYSGTPTLGVFNLEDGGVKSDGSIFVAKLDAGGTVQWVKSFGTMAGRSTALAVAADGTDIIVVGDYDGSIGIDGIAPNDSTAADVISLKLDANGEVVWAVAHPSPGAAHAYSVAVDQAGNIVLGGKFESAVTCGGVEHLCQGSGFDAFVFKLASNGERIWSYTAGTKDADDVIWDIVIDGDNSVLLAGEVSGDLVPPGLAGMANVPAFTGGTDVLLAKLAP